MTGGRVQLEEVSKSFEAPVDGERVEVLRGISLVVEGGESVAIVGESGSGKSTLLNLIGALDQPTSGRVLLDGEALAGKSADELARLRNERIGYVFQAHHLLPQCTALENVLLPTLVLDDAERKRAAPERARALLERVGLGKRAQHRPGQMSGGECQRTAVVRALINGPRLLLADEPTGSLDARSSDELAELLTELNREQGVTLIAVTHSERLAERMARVLQLAGGRLAALGSPA